MKLKFEVRDGSHGHFFATIHAMGDSTSVFICSSESGSTTVEGAILKAIRSLKRQLNGAVEELKP